MADPIETRVQDPAIERENEIKGLATNAADAWVFLASARTDIDSFLQVGHAGDRRLLTEETTELMSVAGWNPSAVEDTMSKSFISYENGIPVQRQTYSSFRHYAEFVGGFESAEVFERSAAEALRNNPDQFYFFRFLYQINPLTASTISILYDQSRKNLKDGRNEFNFEKWYVEAIDNARDAAFLAHDFFNGLASRVNPNEDLTLNFLTSWDWESLLPIVEAASLITTSALHTRVQDCAVYMTSVPVNVPVFYDATHEKIMSLWEPETLPDGRTSSYNMYMKNVQEHNSTRPEQPIVPIYVNVTDEIAYVKFLKRYWGQLLNGMNSKKGIRARQTLDGTPVFRLGNAADVLVRPTQDGFRQARISLEGTSNLAGFNIRVDHDTVKRELSVDFGSISADEAIAYADDVRKRDIEADAILDYSKLVGSDGAFRKYGKDVVSVMGSTASYVDRDGRVAQLTDGNKAALIASVAMQEGNALGIRSERFFLYHSRQFIDIPEYRDNFPRIAAEIERALRRSSN